MPLENSDMFVIIFDPSQIKGNVIYKKIIYFILFKKFLIFNKDELR